MIEAPISQPFSNAINDILTKRRTYLVGGELIAGRVVCALGRD